MTDDPTDDTCRTVEVDGEPVLLRGDGELRERDRQFAGEIVRAAKKKFEAERTKTSPLTNVGHVAAEGLTSGIRQADPDATHLRALALNAVAPALKAHGEWLRLSVRRAVSDAVLDAVLPLGKFLGDQLRDSDATIGRVITAIEAGPTSGAAVPGEWESGWDAAMDTVRNALNAPTDPS